MGRALFTWPSGAITTSNFTFPAMLIRRAKSGYAGEVFTFALRLPSSIDACCAVASVTVNAVAAAAAKIFLLIPNRVDTTPSQTAKFPVWEKASAVPVEGRIAAVLFGSSKQHNFMRIHCVSRGTGPRRGAQIVSFAGATHRAGLTPEIFCRSLRRLDLITHATQLTEVP